MTIVATALMAAVAEEPPPDLARRVARRESETRIARDQYAYRQTVVLQELNDRGARQGEFREVREVVFSPTQERSEKVVDGPFHNLKRLQLTPEDYSDIRDIQPFVFTDDLRFLYETKFRGEEVIDGVDCWILQTRPRQLLQGQRLFEGLLWIDKRDFSVIRSDGQAVPQIRTTKSENLFPRFTTIRRQVDGKHWFPIHTYADDTLHFRTGPIRVRLTIRYANYQKFGAESNIRYEEPAPSNPPAPKP